MTTNNNHDYYTIVNKPNHRTISFIGDKYENVQAIIEQLESQYLCQRLSHNECECSIIAEFKQILIYFYQKIYKLRQERQFYKQKFTVLSKQTQQQNKKYILQLERLNQENLYFKNQCLKLSQQKSTNREMKLIENDDTNLLSRNSSSSFQQLQQILKIQKIEQNSKNNLKNLNKQESNNFFDQNFNNNLNPDNNGQNKNRHFFKQQGLRQRKETIESNFKNIDLGALLKKYNIKMSQLQIILQEYLQNEKGTHEMFQKQEERRLFLLAKKMEKDMWNKKIKRDIEKIMQVKSMKKVPAH